MGETRVGRRRTGPSRAAPSSPARPHSLPRSGLVSRRRFGAGVGLRLYRNDLYPGVRAPTAIGISLGTSAQLSDKLSAAVVVEDLFARYEWNATGVVPASATDYFPTRVRGGLYVRGWRAVRWSSSSDRLCRGGALRSESRETSDPTGVEVIGREPSPRTDSFDFTLADVLGRAGAEVWLVDGFAVRAGLDRIGAGEVGELRPSGGFGLEQRFGELDLKLDYAVVVEPFGSELMHLATVRLGL